MWPLAGLELVDACGGVCSHAGLAGVEVSGAVTDSRKVAEGDLFVAVKGEKFDGHAFVLDCLGKGAVLALVSRAWFDAASLPDGAKEKCVVVDDVLSAFRALSRRMRRRFTFPVVGIGGSNGKTTTKEMLAAMLSGGSVKVTKTIKSENGYLGVAMTLCSREHSARNLPRALVLEIGIDEPGAMSEHLSLSSPDFVLLTALGPEHLAGLGTWERAVEEEFLLFSESPSARRIWQLQEPMLEPRLGHLRDGDVVVGARERLAALKGRMRDARVDALVFEVVRSEAVSSRVRVRWIPSGGNGGWEREFLVSLPGAHNVNNFALACAAACAAGIPADEIEMGWSTFQPPEMRSRIVSMRTGGVLYDDCYNSSPASVAAALESLGSEEWKRRGKIVVLGDMLDLGEESKKWHLELLPKLLELKNTHLCLYGAAMHDVFKAINEQKDIAREWQGRLSYLAPDFDPRRFVEEFPEGAGEAVILVKGSRGMDLGRVVAAVTERYGVT